MVITLYAGILGLIYMALSFFVIQGRFKYRVSLGAGGDENMEKRIRLHANFIEYVPLALILMFFAEQEGSSEVFLHILGVVLLLGRVIHPLGLYHVVGTSMGRTGGMILTLLVIMVASLLCIQSYFVF